jgi:hypothetical protein
VGSIPATLVMLLTSKYDFNKNLQSPNRLNLNQSNNINLIDAFRNDSGVSQILRKKQPKFLAKVLLNSFTKTTKNPSRKEVFSNSRAKTLLSALKKSPSFRSPTYLPENYIIIQQIESQIKSRLSRIESSRRVLNTTLSTERSGDQTQELISF